MRNGHNRTGVMFVLELPTGQKFVGYRGSRIKREHVAGHLRTLMRTSASRTHAARTIRRHGGLDACSLRIYSESLIDLPARTISVQERLRKSGELLNERRSPIRIPERPRGAV